MKRLHLSIGLLAAVAVVGCKAPAQVHVTLLGDLRVPVRPEIKTLAIVANPSPDDLPPPARTGGKIVDLRSQASGMLAEYIGGLVATHSNGRFQVVDRSNVKQLLKEQNFAATGLVDPASAVQAGKMLQAHAMVFGNVMATATQWREEVKTIDLKGSFSGRTVSTKTKWVDRMSITAQGNLRMVDVETGQVLVKNVPIQASWDSKQGKLQEAFGSVDVKDPLTILPQLVRSCAWDFLASLYDTRTYELPLEGTKGDKRAVGSVRQGPNFYATALDEYQVLAEVRPDDHKAWYNVGVLAMALAKYDQSREALRRAVGLKPDQEKYRHALALLKRAERFSHNASH